jgi:putative oxidoreductase
MDSTKRYLFWAATIVLALYVIGGGAAKLAGVERLHQSFSTLGLPAWFGYFIGACEIVGGVALFWRPMAALAAAGLLGIMAGALYYHVNYTPLIQALPAFILILLCVYVFLARRADVLRFS